MLKEFVLTSIALALLFSAVALAQAGAGIPPIKEIKKVKPNPSFFKAAKRNKPLVIKKEMEAAKHFGKAALAELSKQVDFKKQFVLVFAWKGSGQDKLTYVVAESFPEQIFFRIKPGFTRDLRPHVKVFALRSNVKWKVRGK